MIHQGFMAFFHTAAMDPHTGFIIRLLNEALDAEHSFYHSLEEYASKIDFTDPEVHGKLTQFAEKAHDHTRLVGDHIARLGGAIGKRMTTAVAAALLDAVEGVPKDTDLMRLIDLFTSAEGVIARYSAVLAAAREQGLTDAALSIESVLTEEQEIAEWLAGAIPQEVKDVFEKQD